MSGYLDTLIRAAQAVEKAQESDEETRSCDEGHIPPNIAAQRAKEAATLAHEAEAAFSLLEWNLRKRAQAHERAWREEQEGAPSVA